MWWAGQAAGRQPLLGPDGQSRGQEGARGAGTVETKTTVAFQDWSHRPLPAPWCRGSEDGTWAEAGSQVKGAVSSTAGALRVKLRPGAPAKECAAAQGRGQEHRLWSESNPTSNLGFSNLWDPEQDPQPAVPQFPHPQNGNDNHTQGVELM